MSHVVYYTSIAEHLFLLEQLAHGSQSTVKYLYETLDTKKKEDYSISEFELSLFGFGGFEYGYWDYLHKMVSDYLIQCAIRIHRIFQLKIRVIAQIKKLLKHIATWQILLRVVLLLSHLENVVIKLSTQNH